MATLRVLLCIGVLCFGSDVVLSNSEEELGESYQSTELLLCEFCDQFCDENHDPITHVPFTMPTLPDAVDPEIYPQKSTTPTPQCYQEITQGDTNQTITWPDTNEGDYAVSEPICLDDSLSIVKRHCSDNWDDVQPCSSVQQPIDPCPSDLKSIGDRYCYTILDKTTFPPKCPYPTSMDWDEYANLNIFPKEPVWMPVQRIDTNIYGIDLYRHNNPDFKYNVPFQICTKSCRTFFYNGTFLDKKCQVYHNNTHVEAVDCDAEYPAICIYDALAYKASSYCGQVYFDSTFITTCKQGGYSSESLCLCETTDMTVSKSVLAEFLQPHQNLLFVNHTCRIGLRNTKNQTALSPFMWTTSNSIINYTNWAPKVDFSLEVGVMTSEGWAFADESPECTIYQIPATVKPGELNLFIENASFVLNITSYKSFLSNNNKDPIVYCFTDADVKSIYYRLAEFSEAGPVDGDNYTIKFSPIDVDQSGPGYYWCQAFMHPNLSVVTSNRKKIDNFTGEYVALFRLNNYEEKLSSFPLKPDNLETLQNLFENEISTHISFYPRIFKINGIDEQKKEMNITFHLTSTEARNTKNEFNMLERISVEQTIFEFLDFRTVHYCPRVKTQHTGQTIIWPQTIFEESTSPLNGHCVTENVTFVQRTCTGNFIDGAHWSDIEDECHFYSESLVTDDLIRLAAQINQEGDEQVASAALAELYEISQRYDEFNTLDFVLTAIIMKNIAGNNPDLNNVSGIVSNLMRIARAVLLSAQLNFRSTDILLEAIDTALERGNAGEWKKENFAAKVIEIENEEAFGLRLQNCSSNCDCDLVTLTDSSILYNASLILAETVDAAICLSSELYEQIVEYSKSNSSYTPKLVISVYYGSQLFVELQNITSSDLVFGVMLPEFPESFKGPVSIYYFANSKDHLSDYNCSYWKFNSNASGSWSIEDTQEISDAVVCEFYHLTNFGFTSNIDITTNLPMCLPEHKQLDKCFPEDQFSSNNICRLIDFDLALNQFCLLENLTLIPTECFDSFNETANLSEILPNCTKYELTKALENLLELLENFNTGSYEPILELLLTVTDSYSTLSDVELLFVVSFIKAMNDSTVDVELLTGIVNNIMHVPKEVLYQAQKSFKIVDVLLNKTEEIITAGDCGEWKTDKFVIKCLNVDELHNIGLMLKNCSQGNEDIFDCDLQVVNSTDNYNDLSSNTNGIYAVVVLSETLHKQLLRYQLEFESTYKPRLIICIYYGAELFADLSLSLPIPTLVFGVLLPDFNEEFEGPLQIFYSNGTSLAEYNCSYWRFNESDHGTWATESRVIGNGTAICEFFHLTIFAMPSQSIRLTELVPKFESSENLINAASMLVGSAASSNNLGNITPEEYVSLEFNYANIFLSSDISKVFQIHNSKEFEYFRTSRIATKTNQLAVVNLNSKLLGDIVHYHISRFSQPSLASPKFAADVLLEIDEVIKLHHQSTQINRENVSLMIVSQNDFINFRGFFITTDRQINCIHKESHHYSNFDEDVEVIVTLNKEVRRQVEAASSRVVFVIYYTDILFADTKKIPKLPIIEVLIPGLPTNKLQGDLSITYMKNAFRGSCTYWAYTNNQTGYWEMESDSEFDGKRATCNFSHITHFALVESSQNITTDLEQIFASNLTGLEKLKQVYSITTTNHHNLVPVDIFIISQIINNSLVEGPITTIITKIVSNLFKVPRSVLRESQILHSATDILLYAIDKMSCMVNNVEIHQQNFSVIVQNLYDRNFTGILLYGCALYTCSLDYLYDFPNISQFATNDSIAALIIFSDSLREQIRSYSSYPKIAISIFHSDAFFNEENNQANTTKIFGVTFPGLTDDLNGTISVINNIGTTSTSGSNQCAYWYYDAKLDGNTENITLGKWITDVNEERKNKLSICNYTHITHFGMLLANDDDFIDDPILEFITDIGCIASLFGIMAILLTGVLFKRWRQNTGNKILINFSVAISLKIVTLYISEYVKSTSNGIYCTITGCLLHYAILSECAWMLTVAILQFKRFVEVLGGPPKYVLVKALICGWVFPIIPVICVILIDNNNYEQGLAGLCYPSNLGLYLGVWLPVLLVLLINCIIFLFIIYNVFHRKTEYIETSSDEVLFQWRLALSLFFMLGMNWTFGFLGQINGDIAFIYLFCITATLQGLLLFLIFIVFNKSTRMLYSQSIKQWFYARGIFKVYQQKAREHHK
uniref:G-protein coupled receptors family 2 profile 2 domain-containing protein n=1 Tax=Dendroctonus ponderosae TaxID=77166 RepID=A0AAR5PU51_DENPD